MKAKATLADPHHIEPLDGFDIATVRAYRAGLSLAALAVGGLSIALVIEGGGWLPWARFSVLFASALIALNLHIYDRLIRYIISASAWTSALLALLAALPAAPAREIIADAALGFSFVVFSAVALKERYCFRLPIVVAIPVLLAFSLVPLRAGLQIPAAAMLLMGALALGLLTFAKLRMPLHYDIGDKRRYQV